MIRSIQIKYGNAAYLQAPYYEKLTAVVVYEVVGSVTIPYACIPRMCMHASMSIVGTVIQGGYTAMLCPPVRRFWAVVAVQENTGIYF